jgi:low affinity Fe/Cu permease
MMQDIFPRIATASSRACGRPLTFLLATLSVIIWAAFGPVFHYSDTWQLVANTATTIITFLVVFLIQNSQNRDTAAIHLKLDELIRAIPAARNTVRSSETLTEEAIKELHIKDEL